MALWKRGKSAKRLTTAKIDTLIGVHTEVCGTVLFSGGLHIDGLVKGDVRSRDGERAFLTLSESGVIEGDVTVPSVVLSGRVVGNVTAGEHVELKRRAEVTGDVHYHLLEMAMGAEVSGNLVYADEEEQSLPVAASPAAKLD